MAVQQIQYKFNSTTGTIYTLSVSIGSLIPIMALDNPNCKGYPILSGTFTVAPPKAPVQTYDVPNGGSTSMIYNGLWLDAADCPSGPGTPICSGIDRLFLNLGQQSSNTSIAANSKTSIEINFGEHSVTAELIQSSFPPKN